MENFLTQFTNEMAEIKAINSEIKVSPEFYGSINIEKGLLTMTIRFYARVYEVYNKDSNMCGIDDWEVNEIKDIKFNGVVIDDLNKLTKSMEDSGLSTLAKNIKVTDDDLVLAIAKSIEDSKLFNAIFKGGKLINTFPLKEQKRLKLEWLIANYSENIYMNEFSVDGKKPTKEQLVEQLKSL